VPSSITAKRSTFDAMTALLEPPMLVWQLRACAPNAEVLVSYFVLAGVAAIVLLSKLPSADTMLVCPRGAEANVEDL
jgi:hypothetical protein